MTQYSNQPNQPNQAGTAPGSSNWSSATGVSDPNYNLVSILYHALQSAQIYLHRPVLRKALDWPVSIMPVDPIGKAFRKYPDPIQQ
ncbi:MAG: hypothetical protein ACRDIV_01815 [Ktedonobacteraceae bacterium]